MQDMGSNFMKSKVGVIKEAPFRDVRVVFLTCR